MTIHLKMMHDVAVAKAMAVRSCHQHHQYYPFLPRLEQQSDVNYRQCGGW
jgi:hypothetical protein